MEVAEGSIRTQAIHFALSGFTQKDQIHNIPKNFVASVDGVRHFIIFKADFTVQPDIIF